MNRLRIPLLLTMMIVIALIATPVLSYPQQQTNYVATLSGKNTVPPVNTHAIGVPRFHMNPDGSLCYSVDVYHITGVLGSHIGTKNGTELADQSLCHYAILSNTHNRGLSDCKC